MTTRERVPLGKAEDWSEERIARLAQVSPEDVAEAERWWRRHAPEDFRDLLGEAPDA